MSRLVCPNQPAGQTKSQLLFENTIFSESKFNFFSFCKNSVCRWWTMCTMFSSQKIRGSCCVKVLPPPSTWTRCTYFCCSFSSSQSLESHTTGLEGPARSFGGDGVQEEFKTNPCTACGSPLPTTTNPLDVGLVVLCFQRAKLKMFILLLLLQAPAQSLGGDVVQEDLKTNPSTGCGSPLPTIPHPGLSHNLPFYVDDPIQATMWNIYHIGTGVRCN